MKWHLVDGGSVPGDGASMKIPLDGGLFKYAGPMRTNVGLRSWARMVNCTICSLHFEVYVIKNCVIPYECTEPVENSAQAVSLLSHV